MSAPRADRTTTPAHPPTSSPAGEAAGVRALLTSDPVVRTIAAEAGSGTRCRVNGSRGSSTSLLAGAITELAGRPVLLVVAHLDEADECADELTSLGHDAVRLPALESLPGESGVSIELFAERLSAVRRVLTLRQDARPVIIAPIPALMQPVPNPASLERLARTVRTRQHIDPCELAAWLTSAGYERVDAVEEPGQFALRGGIIDIFPPGGLSASGSSTTVPVRLDFFGDEIERITEIDLDTMGSDRTIESADLICADLELALGDGRSQSADRSARGSSGSERNAVTIDATGGEQGVSFIELLPAHSVVVLHEPMELTEQARGYFERLTDPRIFTPPAVFKSLENRRGANVGGLVEVGQFSGSGARNERVFDLPVQPLGELPRDAADAARELVELARSGADVQVYCQNPGEHTRLGELLDGADAQSRSLVRSHIAYVHRGFVWGGEDGTIASHIVPYHEMLHRFETRRRVGGRRREEARIKGARAIDTFLDFEPGDFVVHKDHGIAVFHGLIVMKPREVKVTKAVVLPSDRPNRKARKLRGEIEDRNADPDEGLEEYLTLEFAQRAKLHVPASKIDHVQKYVGGFKGSPTLSALGGQRWKKQKESVAESVKDLAGELLRIRAARESMPGIRYPSDTAWQKEFEDEFPFDETEDQLAAIGEIKKDMSGGKPMDRLLCGDVGYGKTEVAIRAAFKAVEFGKQVAVLVPTTVLAEQHERTFTNRFADYPFRVASISRFKTNAEVNAVLADLRKGQVDVIIGTHRLLSKDVKFADLGLVVIDEEQKFGVEHKERLLALRLTVDVLTLSATPIPRTLHMSMLGLRDISSLTTAPLDRRAVVTEVIPFNPRRVQQAIQRELAREGQVFFVHNRVHNILSVADDIQKLAPEARIVVGHGQMPDGELEEVMLRFMRRQADILVSTTIIESGIDIPSANTMLINDADRFGLAELHQLRGRVGRYKHRAYCYMLLSPEKTVTEKAMKRLKAIEEYSMLGAGFKIAMRDLEIRGAGNILGAEQSGHIAAVGYEMYCHLLEKAVKELRHEPTNVTSETAVEIGVSGMIPKRYIASDMRRMEAYRRIAVAQAHEQLDAIERELTQAYGQQIPVTTRRLLDLAALRVSASRLNIRTLAVRDKDVLIRALPADASKVALLMQAPPATPLGSPAQRQPEISVTLLPPPKGESMSEIYVRPPASYMTDPVSLLRVLRARLSRGETPAVTLRS